MWEHHGALRRESLNSGSASSTCVLPSVVCPGKRTPGGCLLSLPPPCVLAAIAVTIVPRTRSFPPAFGFTLLASDSRRLRQSLVAMLLVSLSPVSSQVSAILMVLETWSQGHKNSPSRRGVQGGPKTPLPGAPPGGPPGGPPRGPPPGRPARAGGPGGPGADFGHFWGVFAILGVFGHFGGFSAFWGSSVIPFQGDLCRIWGYPPKPYIPPYTRYTPHFVPKIRKIRNFILSRLGELLNTLQNVHPRGAPAPPRGAPQGGAPPAPGWYTLQGGWWMAGDTRILPVSVSPTSLPSRCQGRSVSDPNLAEHSV